MIRKIILSLFVAASLVSLVPSSAFAVSDKIATFVFNDSGCMVSIQTFLPSGNTLQFPGWYRQSSPSLYNISPPDCISGSTFTVAQYDSGGNVVPYTNNSNNSSSIPKQSGDLLSDGSYQLASPPQKYTVDFSLASDSVYNMNTSNPWYSYRTCNIGGSANAYLNYDQSYYVSRFLDRSILPDYIDKSVFDSAISNRQLGNFIYYTGHYNGDGSGNGSNYLYAIYFSSAQVESSFDPTVSNIVVDFTDAYILKLSLVDEQNNYSCLSDGPVIISVTHTDTTTLGLGTMTGYNRVLLANNISVPSDYDGMAFPSDFSDNFTAKVPNFSWSVAGKNVTVTFGNDNIGRDYIYGAQVKDASTSDDITEMDQVACSVGDKGSTFSFHVDHYGTYPLGVAFFDKTATCDDGDDSVPISGTAFSRIDLVIDGSFFDGATDDPSSTQDCVNGSSVLGVMCTASLLKTCEWTGISAIFDFITCNTSNFMSSLVSSIKSMFIPDTYMIGKFFNNMVDQIQTSLGFLWAPFQILGDMFNLFANQSTNPSGQYCSLPLTMFGASANVELCRWRDQLPNLWSIMRIAIQGGIAAGFAIAVWRKINKYFGNDIEDDIDSDSGGELQDVYWSDERTGRSGYGGKRRL